MFGLIAKISQADVGQQSGENSAMDLLGFSRRSVAVQAQLPGDLLQLAVQVLPFADP
jgi:hypothetical protein